MITMNQLQTQEDWQIYPGNWTKRERKYWKDRAEST